MSPATINICAEDALRATTHKFAKRFRYIEDRYAEEGKDMHKATLEEMDKYWEEGKNIVG